MPVKSLREVVAEAEEVSDFIVKDLLKKGELTDLSGLAKYSGKTTFVMHAFKAVCTGDSFLGEPTEEARILYLTEQGNNFKEATGGSWARAPSLARAVACALHGKQHLP